MTDPRLARIQAAARMPLPRLAADALTTALQLIAALQAEAAALRAAAVPAPLPPPPPPPQTPMREMNLLRQAVERANRSAMAAKAAEREMSVDLERAKSELAVWRSTPVPDTKALRSELDATKRLAAALQVDLDKACAELAVWRGAPVPSKVRRCRCGVALAAGERCSDCRRMRLKPLTCGCGNPMRKEAKRCRQCFVEGRHPPIVVQPATPAQRPSECRCGAVLTPGRLVCRKCSRETYLAKNAPKCLGCGVKLRDVDSTRCRECYRAHRFARKGGDHARMV